MPETRFDLERDLQEASEMADALEAYLLGDQVYGTVSGGLFGSGKKPALTVGALLLRLRRLNALRDFLPPAQQQLLDKVEAKHAQTRREWQMHYDEKMIREAHSRLDAMRAFFEECAQNPRQCAGAYLPEALRRTITQEISQALQAEGALSAELTAKMRDTDSRLRRYVRPSDFVWAAELAMVYPQDVFWWLYFRPPVNSGDNN